MKFSTLRLLSTSFLVSLSGACRVYVAFLFAGVSPPLRVYLAAALGVYGTYTLDRSMDCEEDETNRSSLQGSKRSVGIAVSLLSFLVGGWLLFPEGVYPIILLPAITGLLYSEGVKVPGAIDLEPKGGYGVKNLFVGATWGAYVTGFGEVYGGLPYPWFVFAFFSGKSAVNSLVYDFRDVEGDREAGIPTLPVLHPGGRVRSLMYGGTVVLYGGWGALHVLGRLPLLPAVFYSTLGLSLLYTYLFGRRPEGAEGFQPYLRHSLVNGEFVLAVLLDRSTAFLP